MSPLVFPPVLWSTLKPTVPFLCKAQSHIPLNSDTLADVFVSLWDGPAYLTGPNLFLPKLALCQGNQLHVPRVHCVLPPRSSSFLWLLPSVSNMLRRQEMTICAMNEFFKQCGFSFTENLPPFELLYGPPTLLLVNLSNLWPAGNSLRLETVCLLG